MLYFAPREGLKLHSLRVVNLILPGWHVCPHPLEQHSSPVGQSLSPKQASTQIPPVPGLSGGHCGFIFLPTMIQCTEVSPTQSYNITIYVLYFLRIYLSGENGATVNATSTALVIHFLS